MLAFQRPRVFASCLRPAPHRLAANTIGAAPALRCRVPWRSVQVAAKQHKKVHGNKQSAPGPGAAARQGDKNAQRVAGQRAGTDTVKDAAPSAGEDAEEGVSQGAPNTGADAGMNQSGEGSTNTAAAAAATASENITLQDSAAAVRALRDAVLAVEPYPNGELQRKLDVLESMLEEEPWFVTLFKYVPTTLAPTVVFGALLLFFVLVLHK